ncbi:MAG TPA: hypothetical protein VF624_14650 [Tepidisphaeraceae bacterium]|jgi:hypothetical protein
MSETPPQVGPPPAPGHLDRLGQLHRMSRTAGLGSTDYAAVNTAAVLATILGLLSALSLITPVFLFLPLAGLVVSAIALQQVRGSNGTQTGMLLAVLGLILCLGFAATTGGKALLAYRAGVADEKMLTDVTRSFAKHLQDRQPLAAYETFDSRLKESVSGTQFENFVINELLARLGSVKGVTPPVLYEFQDDPESDGRLAVGMAQLDMERVPGNQPLKVELRFRRTGGIWRIANVPDWVTAIQSRTGAGAPGGPPGQAGPPGM